MDKFQFDDYLQRSLLLDLMELCKYQKLEYFNHDRLLKLKKDLLKNRAISESDHAFNYFLEIKEKNKTRNKEAKKQLIKLYKRK